jgi:SRSO17 transposase
MGVAVAVEVPAAGTRERLADFVAGVVVPLGHVRQRENALVYVRGLIEQGGRKSLQPTLFRLEETPARYESVQQFLADSPWQSELLVRGCAERLAPELGVIAWVVDDTGIAKQGSHSPGVKRQYSGTLGKIGNCQIAVSVHAVGVRGTLPLGWALYLPEEWCADPQRGRKAKIPESVIFQTKPQLAISLCEQAAGWEIPPAPILADCAYGDDTAFRTRLHALEREYVLAVSAQISVYGPETTFAVPGRNGSTGRPRTVARPDRKPESVRALAERLPRRAWKTLPCRTASGGEEIESRFAFVRVVASHPVRTDCQPPRWEWLIIECPRRRRPRPITGSRTCPRRRAVSGSLGWRGCAGRSSSTTGSSKASSASTTTKAAATSASTTTARSSPAHTPSSPSNGSTQKPRGRPDTAADGAAPAARPALLGRPLPNLLPTRRPRPANALQPTRVTKHY